MSLSGFNRFCMLTSLTLWDNMVTASTPTNKVSVIVIYDNV